MQKINVRKTYYHIKHRFLTNSNLVIVVALLVGASWAWGSIGLMQRNYGLQKELDKKYQQQQLIDLEVQNLTFKRNYFQSDEYKELAARQNLGLVMPGESVLILPPNSEEVKQSDLKEKSEEILAPITTPSNFDQWMDFLFEANKQSL